MSIPLAIKACSAISAFGFCGFVSTWFRKLCWSVFCYSLFCVFCMVPSCFFESVLLVYANACPQGIRYFCPAVAQRTTLAEVSFPDNKLAFPVEFHLHKAVEVDQTALSGVDADLTQHVSEVFVRKLKQVTGLYTAFPSNNF